VNARQEGFLKRKYYLKRLAVDHEFGVMATDLDVVFTQNPFEVFKRSSTLSQYEVIFQHDGGNKASMNGGIIYVRKGPKSGGTKFIFDQLWQNIDDWAGQAGKKKYNLIPTNKPANLKEHESNYGSDTLGAGVSGCGLGDEQGQLYNTIMDAAFGQVTNCHMWYGMHKRGREYTAEQKTCEDWKNGTPNITYTAVLCDDCQPGRKQMFAGHSFQVYNSAKPGGPPNTVLVASQNLFSFSKGFAAKMEELQANRCKTQDTSAITYPAVMYHMSDIQHKYRQSVLDQYGFDKIRGAPGQVQVLRACNDPSMFDKVWIDVPQGIR